MDELRIVFALSANEFDADGLLFSAEIHQFHRDADRARVLGGGISDHYGGYVFVVGTRVWNATAAVPYDPGHLRLSLDSLRFAAGLLEQLSSQLDERPTLTCGLTEMTTLVVEFVSSSVVALRGVDMDGHTIHERIVVKFGHFVGELLAATDAFLRFATSRGAGDGEREAGEPPGVAHDNEAFLRRMEAAAERLREAAR